MPCRKSPLRELCRFDQTLQSLARLLSECIIRRLHY
nr:MAG TPA: hypothetical protein [Caudoviricetes sp.]DAU10463.1 MAG TPA: hypothetical protein [Caudoviricetes sp.]